MIKAIIFDFGGVVVDFFSSQRDISRDFNINIFTVNAKKKKECINLTNKIEEGKIKTKDYIMKVSSMFNIPKDKIRKYMLDRYYTKIKVKKEVLKLIKQLKKKYIVALLSNCILEHMKFNAAKGRYKLFNPVILSCKAKFRKPSKEIYLLMLKKLALKPNECIFVDDERKFIKTAKKIGMHVILFKNIKKLKKDLTKLGIEV